MNKKTETERRPNATKRVSEHSEVNFETDFGNFPSAPKSVFKVIKGHFCGFLTKKAAPNVSGRLGGNAAYRSCLLAFLKS